VRRCSRGCNWRGTRLRRYESLVDRPDDAVPRPTPHAAGDRRAARFRGLRPARQVMQTCKVTAISQDSDVAGSQAASDADWSIAKPVNGWLPPRGGIQTCGERTCTPFDQLSHSGTPRPEWRKRQATAGFLAHGSSPAPPSRANGPVVFAAGFPLTVAGAAPASRKPGNLPASATPGIPS